MATGRPKIEIKWETVDNLLYIQCTGEEVAACMGISFDTLTRRCTEDHDESFADYSRRKRAMGKPSLRRAQWVTAVDKKNPSMLKFLGKNYLGQKERIEISDDRAPANFIIKRPGDKTQNEDSEGEENGE